MTQTNQNQEHDYWICDASDADYADVTNWFGVVDENLGGIIAYFQAEEQAINFINTLN